ncbi:MAG: DEAD/DEAH box helicase [Fuerstiella sp.]
MSQNSSNDPFYFSSTPSPFDTFEVPVSDVVLESLSSEASPAVEVSPTVEAMETAQVADVENVSEPVSVPVAAEVESSVADVESGFESEVDEIDDDAVTTAPVEYVGEAFEDDADDAFVMVPPAAEVAVQPAPETSSEVEEAKVAEPAVESAVKPVAAEAVNVEVVAPQVAAAEVEAVQVDVAAMVDQFSPAADQRVQVTKTEAHTVKIKFTPQGPIVAAKEMAHEVPAASITAAVAAAKTVMAKTVAAVPVSPAPALASAPVVAASAPVAPAVMTTKPVPVVSKREVEIELKEGDNFDAATGPLFRDLPLSEDVQKAVEATGYTSPTEIQAEIIPHVLEGRDVLAQSQTGTGKTAAFALPILSKIDVNRRTPQVLVLAPTRELAMQVCDSFSKYGSHIRDLGVLAIYGGQSYDTQLRALRRGVQIVVGTPGRVIDHINRKTLDLSQLECLVLDEADEMLNMGFLEDVQFVLEQTPETRQVALFSATMPGPIREIAKRYLNDPVRVTIKQKTMTAESIRQRAVFVPPRDRVDALVRFLEAEESDGVIVFTKTREATVTVAEQLCREGRKAVALNGDMAQNVRERTIEQLKNGKLDILVATDVAARGLDVTRVSHVFNYDMPQDSESYIHRIGRTGRAGRSGQAIIFLTNTQRGKLRMIERATKQPIQVVEPPTATEINAIRIERFKQQISDVIAGEDLSLFQQMVADYATVSKQSPEVIAAALAHLGQQGRSFLMQDRPRRQSFERDDRRGNDRFERQDTRSSREFGGNDRERGGRPGGERSRHGGPPESGMDRYRIEVGSEDGVRPSNIVGAVANEGGIDGEYIGPIRIHDNYSTIDLPTGMPREVFLTLQRTRVAGKELNLRLATEDADHSRPRRNSGPSADGRRDFRKSSSGSGSFGGKSKSFSKQRRPPGR